MEETDQTLEMLIYRAAPQFGPLVKRTDIFHWFNGRNGISPQKYPPVKAFIASEAFQKRVPEAIAFVAGYREHILRVGQAIFMRLGNSAASPAIRQSQLKRINGYFTGLLSADRRFDGITRCDLVKGYDALVFASYGMDNSLTTGYVFHQLASSIGMESLSSTGVLTRNDVSSKEAFVKGDQVVENVYLVDAVDRFSKAPLRRILWFNSEGILVGGDGSYAWSATKLVGPCSDPDGIFAEAAKKFVDDVIWDVPSHGIAKP